MDADLRFIVDENAGKLARELRLAGFDALLFTGADDAAMIAIALEEGRTLLTRDRLIMKRRAIATGQIRALLVESDRFMEQIRQVFEALKLDRDSLRPFTICVECNRRLEERAKEAVKERVPPYVFLTQDQFAECPACGRLYWRGTHWHSMVRRLESRWRDA